MKTEIELNKLIMEVVMKISKKYPELSKYLTEVPVKNSAPESDHVRDKDLQNYYNSLCAIVAEYEHQHKTS